ncbi:MAG: cytochrome c [Myxococcota bacterium]
MRIWHCLAAMMILAACGDPAEEEVAYADVAPILEANCAGCHGDTPSNGAPSTLNTYATASPKADAIVNRAVDGSPSPMPPSGLALSEAEVEILTSWAAAGAPE